jgi:hypothetical protein
MDFNCLCHALYEILTARHPSQGAGIYYIQVLIHSIAFKTVSPVDPAALRSMFDNPFFDRATPCSEGQSLHDWFCGFQVYF